MHFAILHLGCLVKSLSFYLDYQLLPATSSVVSILCIPAIVDQNIGWEYFLIYQKCHKLIIQRRGNDWKRRRRQHLIRIQTYMKMLSNLHALLQGTSNIHYHHYYNYVSLSSASNCVRKMENIRFFQGV